MDMTQAVYVTVLGMALVFLALTIVLLVTIILERLFRVQSKESGSWTDDGNVQAAAEEAQVAAVIATALAIMAQEAEAEALAAAPTNVLNLEQMSQGWKAAGRLAGMQ